MDEGGARIPRREEPWPRRSEREQGAGRAQPPRQAQPPVDGPIRPVPPRRTNEPRPPEAEPRGRRPSAAERREPAEHPSDLRRPARPERPRAPQARIEPPTRPVPRTPGAARRAPTPAVAGSSPDIDEAPTAVGPRVRDTDQDAVAARAAAPPVPRRSVTRERARRSARRSRRTLGSALLATAAATVVPGSGHLMLRHKRTGGLILAVFLLVVVALALAALTAGRSALIGNLLSTRVLVIASVGLVVAALAWIAVVIRTYQIARPRGLDAGHQAVGVAVVTALCLVIAAPLGFAANLANSQRNLLDTLFGGGGGTSAADAIAKPRLNILLVGSDAGPDRTGARTDTMMMASIDTKTARTTLFALPRNIGYAQFPPGTPMAEKFPKGFHDPNGNALSGDYLLNAVYAWGLEHPAEAPTTPTANPGLNLLHQTVAYMLGLDIDYYVEVNMAGFASIIDALGGVTIDVGPTPLPIGGVLPNGQHVKPDGYVPAGVQKLNGDQALWFARSRRDSDDYSRMGRQRCLLQTILKEKSPADVLANFQGIASATSNSVATNISQEVLPQLVTLAGEQAVQLDSVSFDPNLPDPSERDGKFNTSHVDVDYMRQVVQDAITGPPPAATPATTASAPTTTSKATSRNSASVSATPTPNSAAPESLAAACG